MGLSSAQQSTDDQGIRFRTIVVAFACIAGGPAAVFEAPSRDGCRSPGINQNTNSALHRLRNCALGGDLISFRQSQRLQTFRHPPSVADLGGGRGALAGGGNGSGPVLKGARRGGESFGRWARNFGRGEMKTYIRHCPWPLVPCFSFEATLRHQTGVIKRLRHPSRSSMITRESWQVAARIRIRTPRRNRALCMTKFQR